MLKSSSATETSIDNSKRVSFIHVFGDLEDKIELR